MSNSVKRNPFRGTTTCESEKQDKREANRKYRRVVKQRLSDTNNELPDIREVSNVWSFGKDGKVFDGKLTKRELRK